MQKFERIEFSKPQINYFQLTYHGSDADNHRIGMQEASASFYGFSRTIAILGHYYSTGKINAHAPKSEIKIYLETSEDGSFKQTIAAAALGAIVATPLSVFITRAIDSWIPSPDPQTQQIINLLKEQNELLLKQSKAPSDDKNKVEQIEKANKFIEQSGDNIQVIRSITANSFKDIFRPVGSTAEYVGITAGPSKTPIGAVNSRALSLIEADRPDEEHIFVVGTVTSFSRGSKTGVMFSQDLGRGFRFEFRNSSKLPPEDEFSWSQYYQRPIRVSGRFVRFFDGRIKKFLVDHVEKIDDVAAIAN